MSIGIRRSVRGAELACFLNCDHFAALVLTALAADTMRQLAFVAVRTLGGAHRGKEVMAAALCSALLGVAAFRIRHCGSLSNGRRSGVARAALRWPHKSEIFF